MVSAGGSGLFSAGNIPQAAKEGQQEKKEEIKTRPKKETGRR